MVVDVRLGGVVKLLFVVGIIVAVGQLGVIVLVGMPVGLVLKLVALARAGAMVVGHVVVVVGMDHPLMGVGRRLPFPFGSLGYPLLGHEVTSAWRVQKSESRSQTLTGVVGWFARSMREPSDYTFGHD
jgi:hypothetical protein